MKSQDLLRSRTAEIDWFIPWKIGKSAMGIQNRICSPCTWNHDLASDSHSHSKHNGPIKILSLSHNISGSTYG